MTPALTLNGEANFEWQPAAKATTQLITHVTSKYGRAEPRQKKNLFHVLWAARHLLLARGIHR